MTLANPQPIAFDFVQRSPCMLRSNLLTNHTLVLLCIAQDRDARVRTIAERVGITERAVQAILGDLVGQGCLQRTRIGRRNRYRLVETALLGPWFAPTATIGDLIDGLLPIFGAS
jgi:hypothetical protein